MTPKQLRFSTERKRCRKCGQAKTLSEFYRSAGMKDGHRHDCKPCNLTAKRARYAADPAPHVERTKRWQERNLERYRKSQRAYKEANRERIQRQNREAHLLKQYGITIRDFELFVQAQSGRCLICQREEGESLHVDHDHETGAVRGLLCGKCNKAIGLLDEDPALFRAAERYLRATKLREWVQAPIALQ